MHYISSDTAYSKTEMLSRQILLDIARQQIQLGYGI